MIWTKVRVTSSGPHSIDQDYAVPTGDRGEAVRRVLAKLPPERLACLDRVSATQESGPLEHDEGLPLVCL